MKTTSIFTLWAALLLAVGLATPALAAERTVELRVADVNTLQVRNLAGSVRLVPGGNEFVIRARIHADRQDLADAIELRRSDSRGRAEVVVAIPDNLSRVRYDGEEFRRLDVSVDYLGRRVRVSGATGERLRVDLEITVPAGRTLEMRQGIGGIEADGLDADLALESRYGRLRVNDGTGSLAATTASGSVAVTRFRGDVNAQAGSGSLTLDGVLGGVHAKTGSGAVNLRAIDGDQRAESGSGAIRVEDSAGSLTARTGSGSVRVEGLTSGPELNISTGSGSVTVSGNLGPVRQLSVRTGSGSVRLDSSTELSLDLHLSTGSGSLRVDVPTISNVESGRRSFRGTVGAGAGQARIATGSGSVRVTAP